MSRAINIVTSNALYFIPAGFILAVFKICEINQFIIVGVSVLVVASYYLYIVKKDEQLNKMIKRFGFKNLTSKN